MQKGDHTKIDKNTKNLIPDGTFSWLLIVSILFLGLVFFILILLAYYKHSGDISTSREDWATFGSVMSGASSFLAGMGTLGVILLSIKQFKMQQDQITKQNKILEAQEKRATFDLYQNHLSAFKLFLTELENELKTIRFTNKNQLYKEVFPNNTQSTFSFTQEKNVYLEKQIRLFNVMMAQCKKVKNSKDIEKLIGCFGSLNENLLIEFENQNLIGDISYVSKDINLKPLGANVHLIDEYTYKIMTLLERLASFADVNIPVSPRFTHLESSTALLEYTLKNLNEDNLHELTRIAISGGEYYQDCLTYLIEMQKNYTSSFIFCRNNLIDKESFINSISVMQKAHEFSKSSETEGLYNKILLHLDSAARQFIDHRRRRR